jgi:hypothetical protein
VIGSVIGVVSIDWDITITEVTIITESDGIQFIDGGIEIIPAGGVFIDGGSEVIVDDVGSLVFNTTEYGEFDVSGFVEEEEFWVEETYSNYTVYETDEPEWTYYNVTETVVYEPEETTYVNGTVVVGSKPEETEYEDDTYTEEDYSYDDYDDDSYEYEEVEDEQGEEDENGSDNSE